MKKVDSGYTLGNGTKLFYVILDNGFDIYFGENAEYPMYHQPEPFIPNPDKTYEENAINMCKELTQVSPNASKLDSRLLSIESNIDYLMLLGDQDSSSETVTE